jgi:hypothetical protein
MEIFLLIVISVFLLQISINVARLRKSKSDAFANLTLEMSELLTRFSKVVESMNAALESLRQRAPGKEAPAPVVEYCAPPPSEPVARHEAVERESISPSSIELEYVPEPEMPIVSEYISTTPLTSSDRMEPEVESVVAQKKVKPIIRQTVRKPPPKIVEDVKTILSKIWQWILVGEEFRPKNVSMEYALASTWLMRLGIIALVVCVGYFLKWSIDRGLLAPTARVALSIVAGVGMLTAGMMNINRKYHILGQGFMGGGLATLYFSMFSAGPMYHLMPLGVSFALMAVVTATAGVLAITSNSLLVAIFGIIGGYATPIILRTGEPNLTVLYGYLLLLGVGVLCISHVRQWRLLNYLAFLFTWGLYFASAGSYKPSHDFPVAIVFLSLLFVVHSAIVLYYNMIKRRPTTMLEIIHLILNALLFTWTSYYLIVNAVGRPWPALMAIGCGLFFTMQILVFLRRRLVDRNLLLVLVGLAGFYIIWAVPLVTERETLTVAWALLALFFLWVGQRLNSNAMTAIANILYIIVLYVFMVGDIPRAFDRLDFHDVPFSRYLQHLWSHGVTFAAVIFSLFGAAFIYRQKSAAATPLSVDPANDTPAIVARGTAFHLVFWMGAAIFFYCIYFESGLLLSYYTAARPPVQTILWCGLIMFVLHYYRTSRLAVYLVVANMLFVCASIKILFFDQSFWDLSVSFFRYGDAAPAVFFRLIDWTAFFFVALQLMSSMREKREPVDFRSIYIVLCNAILFFYTSLETNTLFHFYIPVFQAGAISVLWALCAIIYLLIGLRHRSRSWRVSGLVIFVIVAFKVFLLDLAELAVIYRVLAFMIVGVLMLGGSFAYIKANKLFIAREEKNDETGTPTL